MIFGEGWNTQTMKKKIKGTFKNFLFNVRRLVGIEKQSVLLGEIRAQQIRGFGKIETLADAEFSVFSQWGEDGILSWLVDIVQPKAKKFVEFGVEDYRESNTRYLLMTRYWSGLVMDGSDENLAAILQDNISYKYDLKSVRSFITRENISEILSSNGMGDHLGILSVDIDGVDYWVLEAIQNSADIVVVEYNAMFPDAAVTVPYDPAFVRLQKHWSGLYCGASLPAFQHLLEKRGYKLVGTNKAGTNAFFVATAHFDRVMAQLDSVTVWPCNMREARDASGKLSFQRNRDCRLLLAELPFIDVTTGKTVSGKDIV